MTLIILAAIAVVLFIAIDAIIHPEKQEKARADIQRRKEEKKKKRTPAPVVYRKTFDVISEDKKYGVIESRFEKKEFWQNGLYLSSMRELNNAGYDVGDIIYKWNIQPLSCRADPKENGADIYASADGSVYEYIGVIPDLDERNKDLFVDSKLTIKAEGGTGYEILYNSSAQRRKKGPEKYYPWRFSVSIEKTVVPDE